MIIVFPFKGYRSCASPTIMHGVLRSFVRGYAQKREAFAPVLLETTASKSRKSNISPFRNIKPPAPEWWNDASQSEKPGEALYFHSLNNYKKAIDCVSFLDPQFYRNTTIVEVNPGPGIFTRALFNQINPQNHVLFDHRMLYKPALSSLVKASNGVIKHLDLDGWDFLSYNEIIKRKIINPEVQSRSAVNSSLLFVANFTESDLVRADGLVSQMISFMSKNLFLYHYGRVRTLIWMQGRTWPHLFATVGSKARKKVTVIRELTCDARVIATTPTAEINTHNTRLRSDLESIDLKSSTGYVSLSETDFTPKMSGALIELIPFQESKTSIPLPELEYLILKLFMVAQQPIGRALRVVAPGADILADSLGPISADLTPLSLSTEQWVKLANAFHNWHFKPDVHEDEMYFDENKYEEDFDASLTPLPKSSSELFEGFEAGGLGERDEMDTEDSETGGDEIEYSEKIQLDRSSANHHTSK